jgi:DNA-binding FadR family transcriptional regulator
MAMLHDSLFEAISARDAVRAESITLALLDRHSATLSEADAKHN